MMYHPWQYFITSTLTNERMNDHSYSNQTLVIHSIYLKIFNTLNIELEISFCYVKNCTIIQQKEAESNWNLESPQQSRRWHYCNRTQWCASTLHIVSLYQMHKTLLSTIFKFTCAWKIFSITINMSQGTKKTNKVNISNQ